MSELDAGTWYPRPEHFTDSNVAQLTRKLGVADYDALYRLSIEKPDVYWRAVVDFCGIAWSRDYADYVDVTRGKEFPRWFVGGELNWTDTVLARADDPVCRARQSVIAEAENGAIASVSYAELGDRVRRLAAGLTSLGLVRGDRIGLLIEPGIDATVSLLAISYIGAIVVPLFSGFGVDPIVSRLSSCGARALISTTGFYRRGRHVNTIEIAVEARKRLSLQFLIFKLSPGETLTVPDTVAWNTLAAAVPLAGQTSARMAPHDPFMIIHTSGTAGKPKGTVHTHGGFPLKIAHDSAIHFDIKAGDIFFWPADMGWIAGALIIASALIHGGTMVCYDGAPDFPDWSRMSKMIARHKVTHFACGPTMIRGFAANQESALAGDVSSIRVLITGGEVIDPENFVWHRLHFGRGLAPLINYSGGSEASGALVSSVVVRPIEPGGFNTASPGIAVDVLDAGGASLVNEIGELTILEPFVGMTQSFWEEDERYLDTYWRTIPGKWVHGDLAIKTSSEGFLLRGRSDDTIKVAGKRLGPAEIEDVLLELPGVSEAAAIGIDDPVKGQMLVVFVVASKIAQREDDLRKAIDAHVELRLGKLYRPGRVHFVQRLPKTRTAKVMRRVIRGAYCNLPLGDISSLDDPSTINEIISVAKANGKDAPQLV
jgi:acetyl-CoA synthetase